MPLDRSETNRDSQSGTAQTATLYRMVMPGHLCPFGVKSKALLEREGYAVDDRHLTSREETDAFQSRHGVDTTPQTFIDGERIGGYDELREFFGETVLREGDTTYRPVVAIFATAFLAALAITLAAGGGAVATLERFVAVAMVLLGLQKLQDVEGFTNTFLGYDLLARREVRYAYFYPYLETGAGLLMLTGATLLALGAAPVALVIGTIGAVSVFKAVWIDRRELKCACVGGGSSVPLGFVSLTENLMMAGMAVWMVVSQLA